MAAAAAGAAAGNVRGTQRRSLTCRTRTRSGFARDDEETSPRSPVQPPPPPHRLLKSPPPTHREALMRRQQHHLPAAANSDHLPPPPPAGDLLRRQQPVSALSRPPRLRAAIAIGCALPVCLLCSAELALDTAPSPPKARQVSAGGVAAWRTRTRRDGDTDSLSPVRRRRPFAGASTRERLRRQQTETARYDDSLTRQERAYLRERGLIHRPVTTCWSCPAGGALASG